MTAKYQVILPGTAAIFRICRSLLALIDLHRQVGHMLVMRRWYCNIFCVSRDEAQEGHRQQLTLQQATSKPNQK